MFEAIFWDNDGVLVHTEDHYFHANREVLRGVGVELDLVTFCGISLMEGRSVLDLAPVEDSRREQLRRQRNTLYAQRLASENITVPGIETVLEKLHGKVRMGIVTSSRRDHFETCHARTGLLQYFEFALTREDYRQSKPDPEPYLLAVTRTGIDPGRCLVIEDTPRGLLAARRAGLSCAVLPHPALPPDAFTGALRIMRDPKDILDFFPGVS